MIYLDCAATAMQKPGRVTSAMAQAAVRMASPGRGGHRAALFAAETAYLCRQEAAELFDVEQPENVVFTFNATHALNIAIHTLVKPGSTVLISGYEHNAVTRPLAAIPNLTVKTADGPLFRPELMLQRFDELMTREVQTVICTHVSNVFGYVLPIAGIAELCRERSVRLIVDASQSAGVLPVSLRRLNADFIAMPGHKGLYGPQGTGLLLCKDGGEPVLRGGTGSLSLLQDMPEFLPDRLEAGTHNMPGIAGLLEGLRFVRQTSLKRILAHETALMRRAAAQLAMIPGVRVYRSEQTGTQTGVLSFSVGETDCEEMGEFLDSRGIAVRSGLHCAPLAHKTAGTLERGTVRASFSVFNSEKEADSLAAAVRAKAAG